MQFFPLAAAQLNLRRLLLIRLIVFICQVLALAYARIFAGLALPYGAIFSVLALVVAVNILTGLRLLRQQAVSDLEFLAHLLFDVLALAALLYFSGGANNPFVSFFLVPITISAAILPWKSTWLVAGGSLLGYTLLLFFYHPLPVLMPMEMAGESGGVNLHIVGMWFNFLVSAALITYFVVKMADEIRIRENELNHYREETLRDEQILAVATQAAGTAHELGTPLNTMSILVKELADENEQDEGLSRDLSVLEQQISICKRSLRELVNRADLRQAGHARQVPVREFVEQIRDQWSLLRPEVKLTIRYLQQGECPIVAVDSTLQQALVNILNNAADVSPGRVDVDVDWHDSDWLFRVRDYGEGIREEVVHLLGTKIITDKEKGMGIGMILSQASINRIGGRVQISAHHQGGTVTEIRMPLVRQEVT